ncbi:Clavaminate synthase-like protein [Wolfiporia cocos MD-104 SS10]|uniref:Clavaminate synthase-like protein n=1 Tax=Wolfiporia cocos (strain MD-104) TaxID=742152 RepID=A0A2H3JKR1_WOLCO|nr:Clavaminate synthase-like protein [Wolfiporia cocos MD-104 SS10]
MVTTLDVERIEASIPAAEFFEKFVSKRKPVVLNGLPDDPSFKAQRWTEPLHAGKNHYGTDVQREFMPLRAFLDSLGADAGPHHYLTTQYSGGAWDALTVCSPPTDALRDDFPAVPRVMGRLCAQQVNLWLGRSGAGTSSGLHHDYHDNLYCLLRGRKRFVLFPPAAHAHLAPHGVVHAVHANGVIAYDPSARADGLDARTAAKARVRALEGRLGALGSRGKGKGKGKGKGRADTEERRGLLGALEDARRELAALAGEGGSDDEDEDEDEDEGGEALDDCGSLAGDLEDGVDDYDALMGGADDELDGDEGGAGPSGEDARGEEPPSFSRIPAALLHRHLGLPTTARLPEDTPADAFAGLAEATAYVVELRAGEMLYLPASWWHEVTSTSEPGAEEGPEVHMAFNYWFYPPGGGSFEEPYEDRVVWEYLREQNRAAREEASANGERKGKRGLEDAHDAGSKKAKR